MSAGEASRPQQTRADLSHAVAAVRGAIQADRDGDSAETLLDVFYSLCRMRLLLREGQQ